MAVTLFRDMEAGVPAEITAHGTGVTVASEATVFAAGTKSIRFPGGNNAGGGKIVAPVAASALAETSIGFWHRINTYGDNLSFLVVMQTSINSSPAVVFTTTGALQLALATTLTTTPNTSVLLGSPTGPGFVSLNQWAYWTVRFQPGGGSSGAIDVYRNGVLLLSGSGLNLENGSPTTTQRDFGITRPYGTGGSGFLLYVDDVSVATTVGEVLPAATATTARIGAMGAETLVQPTGVARIGAMGAETMVRPTGVARLGAIGAEVMVREAAQNARVTGFGASVASSERGTSRVSGLGLMVASSTAVGPPPGGDFKLDGEPIEAGRSHGRRKTRIFDL